MTRKGRGEAEKFEAKASPLGRPRIPHPALLLVLKKILKQVQNDVRKMLK